MRHIAILTTAAFAAATLAVADANAELKCPKNPSGYGIAIGLAKSCNMIHAPLEDVVAALATLDWDCAQSDLRSLVNGIREGVNYDRYDNHWELCGDMDQYRPIFEKIDTLASSPAAD